jgi:hypothetical protein
LSTAFAADKVHQKGDWSFWICRTKPKKVNSLHTANWGTELMQSKQLLNYNVSKRLPPVKTHAIDMKGADLHWTRVETTRVTESLSSDESSHTQICSHPNSHKSFSIYLSLIADLEMPLPSELLPNPPLDAADPLRYPKACWSTNSTQEMSLMNKHVLVLQQILKEINITYTCNCPELWDQVSTFPQAARWYVFACCCTIRRCCCTQSSPNKSLASDLPHQEKPRHLSWSNWSG